jgi:uncharacterized protein involved in exopolysaccharide biosynthesis
VVIVLLAVSSKLIPAGSRWNFLPDKYTALAKLKLNENESMQGLQTNNNSPLTSLLLSSGSAESSNITLVRELLFSTVTLDSVVAKTNIVDKFDLEESRYLKSASRDIVRGSLGFSIVKGDGALDSPNIFYITYQSIDPVFATEIVASIVSILEEQFKQLTLERISTKKRFIEERISSLTEELQAAKDSLLEFQKELGIVDLSTQAREQTNLIADLRSDIVKAELEIQTLSAYLASDDARIARLKIDIDKKQQLINELTTGTKDRPGEFIPQDTLPRVSLELLDLESEVSVLESIHSMLRKEYEMVKIDEADNSRILQVIQPPEIPEKKSSPSRARLCIVVTVIAFLLSIFIAFIREYFRRIARDPEESAKLKEIKGALSRKKNRS